MSDILESAHEYAVLHREVQFTGPMFSIVTDDVAMPDGHTAKRDFMRHVGAVGVVAIDDEAALICPWASRSPFELRVVPRTAAANFAEDTAGAAMIHTALRLLATRFDRSPELNLWVRTAPRGTESVRWYVDIAPRLTTKAGFELGTGVDINSYPPERAAADLRDGAAN